MKQFLFALIACLFCVTAAHSATTVSAVVFNNLSTTGTGNAVRSITPVKTVIVQGYSNARAEAALAGTFVLQCAPTTSGPWVTCKDLAGNAISTTANAVYDIEGGITAFRGSWTKGGTGNVKAWLLGID